MDRMGILLKSMPANCYYCNGHRSATRDNPDYCIETTTQLYSIDLQEGRPEHCPLQDTTELLELLKELKPICWSVKEHAKRDIAYNILYKALGGK